MALDFSKYTPRRPSSCESCEYYVYDEELDDYACSLSLDEDEMGDFLGMNTRGCQYYKYYDEYKSVHKQI